MDAVAEWPVAVATPASTEISGFAPVSQTERISSVDVVRGIAVLGILLMNIIGFAFHTAVYADPTVAGGATGLDWWVYAINAVLVDGKMRGIFSVAFGAGVVILMGFNGILYEPARIPVCLAHIAVVMMIVKAGLLRPITSRLAAVGQMALSNYILQSIICSTVFYGYGLGLFGTLHRYEVYYVVLACWIIHLAWSPWWLRHYRFGPLEWCWRSLTYWQRQPMRLGA